MKKFIGLLLEKENLWYLFAFLCLLNILSLYVMHDIIITDPQYFTGGNQKSVLLYRKISLFIYFIYPVYCLVKIAIISELLFFGLKTINFTVSFKQLMSVSIIAELIFWIQDLAKIIWFLILHPIYTMAEVENFSFLSLKYFINPNSSDALKSLLHFFSIPELLFWIVLVFGLQLLTGYTFKRTVKIIFLTYGLAIIFFTLARSYIQYKIGF